jgi:hypothetical protein
LAAAERQNICLLQLVFEQKKKPNISISFFFSDTKRAGTWRIPMCDLKLRNRQDILLSNIDVERAGRQNIRQISEVLDCKRDRTFGSCHVDFNRGREETEHRGFL